MAADASTVAVRNASGNLYAGAFYAGIYYCKPDGSSSFNGNLNLNGELQCDSLRVDVSPRVKTNAAIARTIPIATSGGTYYMMLSDVQ
jgi:hypothetical protein